MTFDRAKEIERRIEHKMQRCIYFNGIQNDACKAGVGYRQLVGGPDLGWAARLPCTDKVQVQGLVTCEQCRRTTREEAEAEVKASDESFGRIAVCLKAIREKHGKRRGLRDAMPCPTGCGGTLHYSIAGSNGHVHGVCTTEKCARWMQ